MLWEAFTRATVVRATRAMRRLGLELLNRPSLKQHIEESQIYQVLGSVARDANEALDFNARGRRAAEAAGQSPARWLIEEIQLRLLKGEGEEAFKILGRVQANHLREPGVAEALYTVLRRLGLVTEDGRMAGVPPQGQPPGPAQAAGEPPAAQGAAIWTPGSDAAGPPGQKKPGLWLPGMG